MADIVLMTFNARYHHASFGLRYLKANLRELEDRSTILELDLETRPADALEKVLAHEPRIVGLGVYVWNPRQSLEFARLLKALRPDIRLVAGGPEISFEHEQQEIGNLADHILCGEADLAFARACQGLLNGDAPAKVIQSPLPDMAEIALPYRLYTDEDVRHRTIYVESSRGCPFSCEFCLSSLDVPVRRFAIEPFLREMDALLDRGASQFKFVDRTFNVHVPHACAILRFFLDRIAACSRAGRPVRPLARADNGPSGPATSIFVHFEMVPDRLPEEVRGLLAEFPPGSLQLEVGVQTFDDEVARRIGRQQDSSTVEGNLRFLREHTHAHIHADLIAGLPGESLDSFAAGFDRLLALGPHEIQLGILKHLRGAPIARHTDAYAMVYSPDAPYDILQNNLIDFASMQRIKRMARYWDMYGNSGNFRESLPLLFGDASPFWRFMAFSDFIYDQTGKTHQIALARQFELLMDYLVRQHCPAEQIGCALAHDYRRPGRRDLPGFLEPFAQTTPLSPGTRQGAPMRQSRHL